jgi:heparinase II/III-like protein
MISLLRRVGPRPLLLSRYSAHKLRKRLQQRRLREAYERVVVNVPPSALLLSAPLDLPQVRDLPTTLQNAAMRLRVEAETILGGVVSFLGSGPVSIGSDIDWHRDFKSGYRWSPTTFYQDLEVTRLTDASDAKVPWELSRGHQLLTLARAATLFRDERFARELERQLGSWIVANPPGFGINWVNPMEVAIRAVNWIWAIRTLEAWRPLEAALRDRVTASLQSHGRHLAANLEGSPLLRSNHYLSDVLGLLALGTVIEKDRSAHRWFAHGHRALERQIVEQVYDDGLGFEGSTSYHGLALEIFTIAWVIAIGAGRPFSRRYYRRLTRMLDASRAIRHPNGRTPLFGDGDSGRVLPGGFERPATQDPLLWLGAVALDRKERPLQAAVSPELAWTLGVRAWRRADALAAALDVPATYPAGGLYILRGGGCHAIVRCGDVGQKGAGGHAHNDVLSYELSYGVPMVVDSGTYTYTADRGARNAFRSSRAHNVVVVDGLEVNPLPENDMFHLSQFARVLVEEWSETEERSRLVGSHDGYRRVSGSVLHRRTFELDRRSGDLSVEDEMLGAGKHILESFLHLAPGTTVRAKRSAEFELCNDEARLHLTFWGADDVEVGEGWVSSEFGSRERAPLLVARRTDTLPLRFGYTFAVDGSSERGSESQQLAVTAS